MLSSAQSENCTCLLWRGRQFQDAQHTSVTMLLHQTFLVSYLSFSDRKPAVMQLCFQEAPKPRLAILLSSSSRIAVN